MNAETDIEKKKLVNLISIIEDSDLIHELLLTVENRTKKSNSPKSQSGIKGKRKAGDGKYLISYIADDFDAPLDEMFKDYMPS